MAEKTFLTDSGINIAVETERRLSAQRIAILKFLQKGESHGYEVWQAINKEPHLGRVKTDTVYKYLKQLAKEGRLDTREVPQPGKPPRTVYTLNRKGKRYAEWATYHHELDIGEDNPPSELPMTEEGADNDKE